MWAFLGPWVSLVLGVQTSHIFYYFLPINSQCRQTEDKDGLNQPESAPKPLKRFQALTVTPVTSATCLLHGNKGVFGGGSWIALGFRAHRSGLDSEVAADGRKWGRLNAGTDVLINWGLQEGHSS